MPAVPLSLKGMKVEEVYDEIVKSGVSESNAATIVGSWIFENLGRSRRGFNYRTAFPGEEPDCAAVFQRTFAHADWVDGEDVVQAEQTAGEDGFNVRFHSIEHDLDALGQDVAKAFACMAEMRRDLRALLDEIRAELNQLNADVFDCCKTDQPTPFPGKLDLDRRFEFVTTTKFLDRHVQVFKTPEGLTVLPAIETVGVSSIVDPRVKRAAGLSRFVAETAAVREFFKDRTVTKQDFVTRFGEERARDGSAISELLEILPAEAEFPTLDALLKDVSEREAAALRTSDVGGAAVSAAFGLDPNAGSVAAAPVERFEAVPGQARSVLAAEGIATMDALAAASPERIAALMEREGIAATVGDAAEWTAAARTLTLSLPR